MTALRDFMFEHVYLGEVARREHSKIETRRALPLRPLLLAPGGAAARRRETLARRVVDYIAGHDRPLLHPRVRGTRRPARVRPLMARYTEDSIRARQGRRSTWSTSSASRTELRRVSADSYTRPVPVSRRAHAVVQRQAVGQALLLLRLPGAAATRSASSQETEGLDFVGAVEYLADRYSVTLERAEEDPREAERRRRRERLLRAARAHLHATTSACCGTPTRALPAREYLARPRPRGGDPARVPRRLRARAAGIACSTARVASGFTEAELLRGRARAALARAPGERLRDASAAGSPSRCATRAAACSGSARARWRRRRSAQVPQQRRRRDLPQGPPPVRDAPRARRARRSAGVDRCSARATPT